MLIDDLKKRMMAAMKAGRTVEKELLRTALGEITMAVHARGEAATDEMVVAVLRKLQKSTDETLALATDPTQRASLEEERAILVGLVPQGLSLEALVEALAPVHEAIRAAKSDGQGTGLAMKHFKAAGTEVDGKAVAQAVARIRTP